jgi:vacuolar-type H+-ATPase subunit I/STV1
MAFFNKYNGTADVRLLRMERWTWVLIYAGLLTSALSYFMPADPDAAVSPVLACGLLAVAAGVALIAVRSRLHGE